jgi:hypothetical protein
MLQNSEFLGHLQELVPPGSSLWWNAFAGDIDAPGFTPPWGGQRYIHDQSDVDSLVNRNTYYSVAALKPFNGALNRRNECFDRLLVLVADDPDITKLNGEPSYILETSPNNFQVGLFLDVDDALAADLNAVSALMSAMSAVGLMPADLSGNNAVRYGRLPRGMNQKGKHNNFQHRLVEWNPENSYTLADAADVFGITFDATAKVYSSNSRFEEQGEKLAKAVHDIIHGVALHDNINKLASSLAASGLHDGANTNIVRAIVNQSARKHTDPQTWQTRYNEIPKSIDSASKFKQHQSAAPDQEVDDEYQYELDKLKPVEFVIDGFISNKITVIAGPPGVGKTSLLVPLSFYAAHLCCPEAELKPMLKRRVIYVTEDAEQVERIMYGIVKHEQIKEPPEGFGYWFKIMNAKRQSKEELADLVEDIRSKYTINLGPEFNNYVTEPLIVLDTSNSTIDLDNENDNAEAGKAISGIKCAMNRSAIWLVAHTAKVASKTEVEQISARGAGAFEGDANAVAYLLNLDGNRFLTLGKRRFEADYTDIRFESFADSETVSTPWGTQQTVRYRYGIPCVSSAQERDDVKNCGAEAAKVQTRARIRLEILTALANHGEMSKNKIKSFVQGKDTIISEVLTDLLNESMIVMSEFGQKHLYRVVNERPYRKG